MCGTIHLPQPSLPSVPVLLQDLRYALRLIWKNPGFTAIAVMVLALGIGANTAVFSLVNAMLLTPIPTDDAEVVGIYMKDRTRPDSYRSFSVATYEQIRGAREIFSDVLAHSMTMVGVTEGEQTRRMFVSVASANYFSTLGVVLAAGREFSAEEDRAGADVPVAIVSYAFAQRAGGDRASVLGRTVRINARDYTIVGVAPEGFTGTTALVTPEFWLPLGVYEHVADEVFNDGAQMRLSDPQHRPLMLIGRLRPPLDARASAPLLATLTSRLEQADADGNRNHEVTVHALPRLSISTSPQNETGPRAVSALLMGMAGLVLLISCLNLANMLLARGSARRKEIALRLALGSGRMRVVRQLLTESMVIAMLGGAAGLLLASAGTTLLISTLGAVLPFQLTFDSNPDVRVLAATLTFCVLSTVIAGLGPAWRVTKPDVLPDLKEQPRDGGGGRRVSARNVLVVGQVALSLALLTAAGLFMRGAIRAGVADPGFPLDGGIIASLDPSLAGYDETRARGAFAAVLQRTRGIAGVHSASVASLVPFGEFQEGHIVQKAGTPPAPEGHREEGVSATYTIVGADYFESLRIPVLRGRAFTDSEEANPDRPAVAVIDETLARRLFGDADPIGQRIQFGRAEQRNTHYEVVGVAGGVRHDMFEKSPSPHLYVAAGRHYRGRMLLHARLASADPRAEAALMSTLRQEIRGIDSSLPVIDMKTLRQHRDGSIMLWAVNTGARMFGLFGGVALLLAIVGVYGVKAYVVSRRTREIGIRMALGARPADVLWLVLREGLALTAAGLAVGLGLSWAIGKALSGMLYEVSPLDPVVFTAAPAVLGVAALVASYLPARRATQVQPITALRD
jgi:predicted permease